MKTKNKLTMLSLLFALAVTTTFSGCKKYDEGPAISFRSKTERVANTWKVENYLVNGVDFTALAVNYVETFTKDGNYSFSDVRNSGTGRWEFQNEENEIKVSGVSSKSSETLVIIRLAEKHFWYYYMDGSNRNEVHLIPN